MGWMIAIAAAAAALAVMIAVFKAPRKSWEAIAAALVFGLAGFALQSSPGQPGSPKSASASAGQDGKDMVNAQRRLSTGGVLAGSSLLIMADAFARKGQFRDAAAIALAAAEKQPGNAEAWLTLANSLVAHAGGSLTPAAEFAFRRAIAADPQHPGPAFFLGLALAQNGQLDAGRAQWAELLGRTPPQAPWRDDLQARLAELDAFIARQQAPSAAP
ncbi:MAG: tetratricopeptide repeat protein [Novosphingobium sp.]|uniref:tetratricopeptide repeat protein n=1 Tax=Novosphingobium sp. TaxID=1874826 RepID=UPI0032BD9CD4